MSSIDLTKPYCTYATIHPSGFYYLGKGITINVASGKYRGSGVKFKVTCSHPDYLIDTWTTTVLQTFDTEDEAFAAEELLVPLERLKDPYCLNMQQGGRKGTYKTISTIYKQMVSAKKKAAAEKRKAAQKAKVDLLKQKLKDKK